MLSIDLKRLSFRAPGAMTSVTNMHREQLLSKKFLQGVQHVFKARKHSLHMIDLKIKISGLEKILYHIT